jgi:peroxin-3
MTLVDYFYERRRGLTRTVGAVGGLYVVGRYVSERLDTMRTSFVEERGAQDK